jgi:anti-sigma regulatory factor (Ser/Thr protein kinase)
VTAFLLRQQFVAEPHAVRAARRACDPLAIRLAPGQRRRLILLVGELVTNSIRHGSRVATDLVELVVRDRDGALRVEVHDRGSGFERPRPPRRGALRESGWGLLLVNALADRWGVERGRRRSTVWFELDRVREARRRPSLGAVRRALREQGGR